MFFAPPKVKSLSRYAEFGNYLGPRYFLAMVGAAFLVHAAIIGFYASLPREEVMQIPVRVLNIKLGGGSSDGKGARSPEVLPAATLEPVLATGREVRRELKTAPVVSRHENTAEDMLDKELGGPDPLPPLSDKTNHPSRAQLEKSEKIFGHLTAEQTLAVPKHYVRSAETPGNLAAESQSADKVKGSGGGNGGKDSEEIVGRYEQAISLWMAQHKIYPETARRNGVEGNAVVRVRINRHGHIIYNAIERSSGNAVIDQAVIAMVRSSDPVPSVPENYPPGREFEFLIPVSFHLE